VAVDPDKIIYIMEWPTPKDVSHIISLMVLAGYYRRFIKGFSKIGCPITALQKKGVKFTWTSECEEIFQVVKYLLTHTPVLKIANTDNDFLVCTNFCKEGLGGVLMQEGCVICHESIKLCIYKWFHTDFDQRVWNDESTSILWISTWRRSVSHLG
jgi:hypothetical protein